MAQQQWLWKGTPVRRAKAISPEKWEEHKEELCDLYPKIKLDDLMVMMKMEYRFTPSRRQYISQFEKWEIQKYNKKSWSAANDEGNTRDIAHLPSPVDCDDSETGDPSRKPLPKAFIEQVRSTGMPEVAPKKHRKLSNGTAENVHEDVALAFDQIALPEQSIQQPTPVDQNESNVNRSVSPADDIIDLDFSEESANIMLDTDLSSWKDPSMLEEVKLAADFLFSSQCYADSFALYVLLLEQLKGTPDVQDWKTTLAITRCAQSSVTVSQIEISQNLLEQTLSARRLKSCTEDAIDMFLYRSVLKDIYRKQGKDDAARAQQHLAIRSTSFKLESLIPLTAGNRALSLVVYLYIHCAAITFEGRAIDRKSLKYELIHLIPGPFEYDSGRMRNTTIRYCLQWCISALQSGNTFSSQPEAINLEHEPWNKGFTNFLLLYADLFRLWKRQIPYPETKIWAEQVEETMGISPTELLATVCVMIQDSIVSTAAELSIRALQSSIDDLVETSPLDMLSGAKALSQRSDWELANAFLEAYSDLNTGRLMETTRKKMKSTRKAVKRFLGGELHLKLPDVPKADQRELNAGIARCWAVEHTTTKYNTVISNTLAPSLSSSDFSSLRALKDRLQEDTESRVGEMVMALPSSMIKDEWKSTLSLPPSSVVSDWSRDR